MNKAYLVLSDGAVYEGKSFGAPVSSTGELVFTTGVVGYVETLTDPAYAGQIILQTFPAIGNYGVNEEDFEGIPCARGYVVREWCDEPSNFRSQYSVDKLLKDHNIPGICGVDTRAITRKLRDHGPMNAMICAEIPADLTALKEYKVTDRIACEKERALPTPEERKHHVVALGYGMTPSFLNQLHKRGCDVTVVPAATTAEEILALKPDGLFLPGGPGDPMDYDISNIKALLGAVPMFGIGLGHQLMALASGAETVKMPYGHRGGSQPVREASSGNTYITQQNHGYAVVSDSVKNGMVSFTNANDGTCEGIDYPELNAFSVQFYPDATGPRNTAYLYDRFISMMGGDCHAAE